MSVARDREFTARDREFATGYEIPRVLAHRCIIEASIIETSIDVK
jgi:hypothetical protein